MKTEQTQGVRGEAPLPPPSEPQHAVPPFAKRLEDRPRSSAEMALSAARSDSRAAAKQTGQAQEVVLARTARSTELANPNGTLTVRFFEDVAFVPDRDGVLQPVDTRLVPRSGDGLLAPVAAAAVAFAPVARNGQKLAEFTLPGGAAVGFGLAGTNTVVARVDGDTTRYPGIRGNADLELSATPSGLKETIVLRSATADRTWTFPLSLPPALMPVVIDDEVRIVNRRMRTVAVIPPGFMEDSAVDGRGPASSAGVTYAVEYTDVGWVLRVALDGSWLDDPRRVWPVRVDPSVKTFTEGIDDTFVSTRDFADRDNSSRGELRVGAYDSGENEAAYLNFPGMLSALTGKVVTEASLSLYTYSSATCTPAEVRLHAVTQPWAGTTTTSWPGPAYEETPLSEESWANGAAYCPDGGFGSLPVPPERVNAWVNDDEPFYGFTVRASETDLAGYKRFRSANYGDWSQRPSLSVTYVDGYDGVAAILPLPNTTVDTLTPSLWVDYPEYYYVTDFCCANTFQFRVCRGPVDAPVACASSAYSPGDWTGNRWSVPSGDAVVWGEESWWQVRVYVGQVYVTDWYGPWWFTPVVPQPAVTFHLAESDEGAEMPGVNPQVGNYSNAVTDAVVAVPGPALAVTRTYNSQDPRRTGAFGAGWSSPLDQRLIESPDGGKNVTVTLASGRRVRFGWQPGGGAAVYHPPPGLGLTLVRDEATSSWTLRDSTGISTTFDADGLLTTVTDASGRTQTYLNGAYGPILVTDTSSGRSLHLTWAANQHVTEVAKDPPTAGQAAPTWTYSYDGDRLVGACTPLGPDSCTTYTYTDASLYRSEVLDDEPTGYWPLGESSGSVAVNAAARVAGQLDGTYTGVGLGVPGALAGSPDTAADFGGDAPSYLELPHNLVTSVWPQTIELWFRTAPGGSGLLFANQYFDVAGTEQLFGGSAATLYVGNDGKLHGNLQQYAGSSSHLASGSRVDDNAWHHAVLSGNSDEWLHQYLYLDGTQVDSGCCEQIWIGYTYPVVGRGTTYFNWPNTVDPPDPSLFPFTGQIDELAFYAHPLDPDRVAAHHAAGIGSGLLASIVEPGGHVAAALTYRPRTGRVNTLVDTHGATWTLTEPTLTTAAGVLSRQVDLSASTGRTVSYSYDVHHNGRLVQRQDMFGRKVWGYNGDGFVSQVTDENGNTTRFGTDRRGNITTRTACRGPGADPTDCHTEYFGYFLNDQDPLDARNDKQIWSADPRSADANDPTYRTTRTLDTAGQVVQITYPQPAGQGTDPVETFTYTSPPPPPQPLLPYVQTTQARPFIPAEGEVLALTGDEAFQSLSLPFPFRFYGDEYRMAWVSTNGFLAFDHPGSANCCGQQPVPSWSAPGAAVLALWDDLMLDASSSVRTQTLGTAPNRKFVIEWRAVHFCCDTNEQFSVEVVLSESGEVATQYADLDSPREAGNHAIVGIQDSTHHEGMTVSDRAPTMVAGTAVVYTPNPLYPGTDPRYVLTTASRPFQPANDQVVPVDESGYVELTTPFPVAVHDQPTTHLGVQLDGWINVGDLGCALPYWDSDIVIDDQASLRTATTGTAPNRSYILEWRDVYRADDGDSERFSFEAVFGENGEVSFNYAGIGAGTGERGSHAIVSLAGDAWTDYSVYEPVLRNDVAIVYTPEVKPVIIVPPNDGPPPAGLLESHTDRNGGVTTYRYNALGDLASLTDPAGLVTAHTYDFLGRVTATATSSDVDGEHVDYGASSFGYNALDLPTSVIAPAVKNPVTEVWHSPMTTFEYDIMGRPTSRSIADLTGGDDTRTTTWAYDGAGRLVSQTAADSTVTSQEWSAAGDVAQTVLPGGLTLDYGYDQAHRLTTVTAHGAHVDPMDDQATTLSLQTRSYDPAGRLAGVADAMGRTFSHTYLGDDLLSTTTVSRPGPQSNLQVERRSYDPAGHPTTVVAAGGVTTTYAYDPAGNVAVQAFDPTGLNRVTEQAYNLDSTIDHATTTGADSPGRTERVDYAYDGAGRLVTTTVANPGGSPSALTTTLVRDPRGLVTRTVDPTGVATDVAFDETGAPQSVTLPPRVAWVGSTATPDVAAATVQGRNTFGDVTHVREANGGVTVTRYDRMGRVTTADRPTYTPPGGPPIASSTTTTYNDLGLVATSTDALGNTTTFDYDPYGHLTSRTDPDPDGPGAKGSPVWTHRYTRVGELLSSTDPTGAQALATYDELGRTATTSTTDEIDGTTVFFTTTLERNDAGAVTTERSPLGHETHAEFNSAGEPVRVTDATGRFERYGYDLAGRRVSTVSGQGLEFASPVRITDFDHAGRAVSTRDCDPSPTGACASVLRQDSSDFDGAGRPVRTTSASGRITMYGYDPAGLLTAVAQREDPAVAASAVTVELGYDANGNNTRMVDGNGNPTTYTYTPWNLPESTIEPATTADQDPADRTWTTVYDAAGRAVEERLPGGVSRTRTFDNLGQLTAEVGTGAATATVARHLDYDALGHITAATSPAGDLTFAWNGRGLLAGATGHGGGATFDYDADDRLISRTDAAGTATFGYDNADRLSSTVDPLTGTTASTTYDSAGQIREIDLGAGHAGRTYTYDDLGRTATDQTTRPDGTVSVSATYGYDLDDLPTSKSTTGVAGAGTNGYVYDGLGRVTTWTSDGQTTDYGYDEASNRTTVTTAAGVRTSTFDERNRLVEVTGGGQPTDTYTWNGRGQLTSATTGDATTAYTFDAFERLVKATKPGGPTTTFDYDSLNRPARRNGQNFGYADLSNNAVLSPLAIGETTLLRDPTGAALAAKSGSDPARLVRGDAVHADVTAAVEPTTGEATASASYDPWGVPTSSAGTLPLGYQGGFTEPEIGLVNAHARWYDPRLGSFASRDTVALTADPTTQTNRYLYGNASPLLTLDPTGHWPQWLSDAWHKVTEYADWWGSSFQAGLKGEAPTVAAPAWVTSINNWTDEHRAEIVEFAVSAVVFVGCEALFGVPTGGVGAVAAGAGCGAFAGDIGGLSAQAVRCWEKKSDDACKLDAFGASANAGSLTGLVSGGAGGVFGRGLTTQAASVLQRTLVGGVGGGLTGALGGGLTGGVLEAIGYAGSCQDACSWDGLVDAAGHGGEHGAVMGAIFGALGGAFGAARSCTHSFAPETRVLLADGSSKQIKDVTTADRVTASDPQTGQTTGRPVTQVYVNRDTDLTDLTVAGLSVLGAAAATLHTTQHHPFWDNTIGAWVEAKDLVVGHELRGPDGSVQYVAAVRNFAGEQDMRDLTVADLHSYYVLAGDRPVLVHNCGNGVDAQGQECHCAGRGEVEYDTVPYLPRTPGLPHHHGVMDAWARANVPGYNTTRPARSTTISLTPTNHEATNTIYRDWTEENYGRRVGASVDWAAMRPREILELSERMFDAANVPQLAREHYYSELTRYLYSLG